jgi:hypothetical protein
VRSLTRAVLVVLLAAFAIDARATGVGTLMPNARRTFVDDDGKVCGGCLLFFYASGSSTKQTAYADANLNTALSNPVTLNASGQVSAGGPFLVVGQSYKLVLAAANDTDPPASPIWEEDLVSAVPPGSTSADVDVAATAGETISAGDAVYWSDGSGGTTAGRVYKVDADQTYSSNLALAVGFATAAISTGSSGSVRTNGRVTGLSALVAGTWYYASATAGALTSTKPTNGRLLGIADSTTSLVLFGSHPDASSALSGLVSTGTQTIAGNKTISGTTTISGPLSVTSGTAATFTTAPIGIPNYVRLTSDFTKNNTTTLADVTNFNFAVVANGEYHFRFVMKCVSSAAAGFKFAVTGPADPTGVIYGTYGSNTVGSAGAAVAFGTAIFGTSATVEEMIVVEGYVRNGANAGTVQLQFAQTSATVVDTIIRAESFLIYERRI